MGVPPVEPIARNASSNTTEAPARMALVRGWGMTLHRTCPCPVVSRSAGGLAQLESIVEHHHRPVGMLGLDQARSLDFARADRLDVDAVIGK